MADRSLPCRKGILFPALLVLALGLAVPVHAQDVMGNPAPEELLLKRPGERDIIIPNMNAARGRVYFATRACVVCHKVNGIGGSVAPPLEPAADGDAIDIFDFVTRMWRGARSMVALQENLFAENIDLAPDEMADIIAFINDPAERAKFSEKDIPKFVRDFMLSPPPKAR
jgi:mono/diheme cytochrome c family protein